MKKDTTALNIRIDTSLYNLLQDATKTGQSKTYLVENALRCYLNVESSTNNTNTDETESDRASLEQTVQTLTKEIEHLKGIVKPQEELLALNGTDKTQRTASLNSPKSFGFAIQSLLKEESSIKTGEESAIAATKNEFSEASQKNTPSENTIEETKPTHQDESHLKPPEALETAKIEESAALKPLLQKELVTRLGVSTSAISHKRKKGDDEFKEWSKGKDPDGLAWEYNSETKKFSPVAETSS